MSVLSLPLAQRAARLRPRTLVVGDEHLPLTLALACLEQAGADVTPTAPGAADVLVLVFARPVEERVAAIAEAVATHPDVPVVATMPTLTSGTQLRDALRAGAAGLVGDDELERTLAASVAAVHAGQLALPPSLARWLAPRVLSYREKEVLDLVARGLTNRQIAETLYLAESTVKSHVSSAFIKLDTRSRAEAAALVLERDLDDPGRSAVLRPLDPGERN